MEADAISVLTCAKSN